MCFPRGLVCEEVGEATVPSRPVGLARGLRFKPVGSANEAIVQEPQRRVILKVDADQLVLKLINEPKLTDLSDV
jgi:hypothetical protein